MRERKARSEKEGGKYEGKRAHTENL